MEGGGQRVKGEGWRVRGDGREGGGLRARDLRVLAMSAPRTGVPLRWLSIVSIASGRHVRKHPDAIMLVRSPRLKPPCVWHCLRKISRRFLISGLE